MASDAFGSSEQRSARNRRIGLLALLAVVETSVAGCREEAKPDVLGADRAKLQGWALLHNDTDESWQSVQIDLVNGRPSSFLYPLAAPRYARRELVTPDERLHSYPQLFDTTVDNMWSDEIGDQAGSGMGIGLGSMGAIGHGMGGGGRGEGIGPESAELSIGNLAALRYKERIPSLGQVHRRGLRIEGYQHHVRCPDEIPPRRVDVALGW